MCHNEFYHYIKKIYNKITLNNKIAKKICLLLLLLSYFLCGPNLSYGSNLSYDTEMRFRGEYFNNMNEQYYGDAPSKGQSEDSYLLSRIRVGVTYKVDDSLLFRASGQDSRAFGYGFTSDDWYNKEFNQKNNPQKDYFELFETYIKKDFSNIEFKIGRQKMAYGDNRIFGPGEWKNSGKWIWDAAKATYKNNKDFISFFYGATMLHDEKHFSLNHRHGYYGYGAYSHFDFGSIKLEPMLFRKENDKENSLYRNLESNYGGARIYGEIKTLPPMTCGIRISTFVTLQEGVEITTEADPSA